MPNRVLSLEGRPTERLPLHSSFGFGLLAVFLISLVPFAQITLQPSRLALDVGWWDHGMLPRRSDRLLVVGPEGYFELAGRSMSGGELAERLKGLPAEDLVTILPTKLSTVDGLITAIDTLRSAGFYDFQIGVEVSEQ